MLGRPIKIPGTKVRIPDRTNKGKGLICKSCGRPMIPIPKPTRNGWKIVCPFCGCEA